MSLSQYLRDTRGELRHVSWPTKKQTAIFTALVALISILMAMYLGVFDYLFSEALNRALESQLQNAPLEQPFTFENIDVQATGAAGDVPLEITTEPVPAQ